MKQALQRSTATAPASPLHTLLAERGVVVLDGGLATELERRGADLNDPLWSARLLIERPELIRQLHLDYFCAGADVATTASYQASFEGFARRGLGSEAAAELMRLSVQLAVEARDAFWADPANRVGRARPLVAASIGPYGAMLADGSEYRGDYRVSEAELVAFHRPRMQVLADAGADLLAFETIPCLDEARALARLLPEFPKVSAWLAFSCRDGEHNRVGERLADCIAQLDAFEQIVAIGVNCTAPEHITSLIDQMRGQTAKPMLVYPNSGEQYDAVQKRWHGCATSKHFAEHFAEQFAESAAEWHRHGARLVGGCCRTGPRDIAALRRWVSSLAR